MLVISRRDASLRLLQSRVQTLLISKCKWPHKGSILYLVAGALLAQDTEAPVIRLACFAMLLQSRSA